MRDLSILIFDALFRATISTDQYVFFHPKRFQGSGTKAELSVMFAGDDQTLKALRVFKSFKTQFSKFIVSSSKDYSKQVFSVNWELNMNGKVESDTKTQGSIWLNLKFLKSPASSRCCLSLLTVSTSWTSTAGRWGCLRCLLC